MVRNLSLKASYHVIMLVIDIWPLVQITASHVYPGLFNEAFQSLKNHEASFRSSKEEIGLKNGSRERQFICQLHMISIKWYEVE